MKLSVIAWIVSNRRSRYSRTASPDEVAEQIINDLDDRLLVCNGESKALIRALNDFVTGQLAGLVAAEELGGPIVGAQTTVDDAELDSGFNVRGKSNKKGRSQAATSSTTRGDQRSLEASWGRDDSSNQVTGSKSRQSIAGELRNLIEALLNSNAAASAGTGASPYVEIERESAAVRFLIRAHVALYHPRNPSRIRLVDFITNKAT